MLTDSEVDRRFLMLAANLNSAVGTVEWPGMSDPAESFPEDELSAAHTPATGVGALRIVAMAVVVAMVVAGVVVGRSVDLGLGLILAWFAVVVPGVTLATIFLVDRARRHRDTRP